jgi:uncharacterized membrane protein
MSRNNRPNNQQNTHMQVVQQSFAGPIPPPAVLAQYDVTLPGAAERILTMAETQHAHRIKQEDRVIGSNVSAQKLGVWLGFAVAMTAIIGGIVLIYCGKSTSGLTSIIGALVALVTTFIVGRKRQQDDLNRKNS